MPYRTVSETIMQTQPNDEQSIDSLATAIKDKSLKEPREVVRLAHADDNNTRATASAVLLRLSTLTADPLLDSLQNDPPEDYVWDVRAALVVHLANRARLTGTLEKMLSDTRESDSAAAFTSSDQRPPHRRVCDEAYLMLRRLLSLEESEDERYANDNAFLKFDDGQRDQEIQRLQSSKTWKVLTESEQPAE